MAIPRIVPANADQFLATVVMSILSIPRIEIASFQSIVVFPGIGGQGTVHDAVEYMRSRPGTMRNLVVAGINPREAQENDFEILSAERLQKSPFSIGQCLDVAVQGTAEHTLDQARWIANIFKEKGICRAIVTAAPFHLPRAFLTLISALKGVGCFETALIPLPGTVSPMTMLNEFGGTSWELFAGEMDRVRHYQEQGDILSNQDIETYFKWLWQNKMNLCPD